MEQTEESLCLEVKEEVQEVQGEDQGEQVEVGEEKEASLVEEVVVEAKVETLEVTVEPMED